MVAEQRPLTVIRPDPNALADRVRFHDDRHRQHECPAALHQVEFELTDDADVADGHRELAVRRLPLGEPRPARAAEVLERRLAFDPADTRVVDADPTRERLEQADGIAAQERRLGRVEMLDLTGVGGLMRDLAELCEPHGDPSGRWRVGGCSVHRERRKVEPGAWSASRPPAR